MCDLIDDDRLSEWFGGLFAAGGSFYITKHGETTAGRTRFILCATIRLHISRRELVEDLIDIIGGRFLRKKKAYYNKVTWEARSVEDLTAVVTLLDNVSSPMPLIVCGQLELAKKWLDLKLPPGRPKDEGLADEVQWYREQLYEDMRELNELKQSLEFRGDAEAAAKRRVERRAKRKAKWEAEQEAEREAERNTKQEAELKETQDERDEQEERAGETVRWQRRAGHPFL